MVQRPELPLCSPPGCAGNLGTCGGRPSNGASERLHECRRVEKGEFPNNVGFQVLPAVRPAWSRLLDGLDDDPVTVLLYCNDRFVSSCSLGDRDHAHLVQAEAAGVLPDEVLGGLHGLRRPAAPPQPLQDDLAPQVGVGRRHRLLLAEVAVVEPVGKTYQVRRKSVTTDMGGLPDEVVETCGEGTGERRAGTG